MLKISKVPISDKKNRKKMNNTILLLSQYFQKNLDCVCSNESVYSGDESIRPATGTIKTLYKLPWIIIRGKLFFLRMF